MEIGKNTGPWPLIYHSDGLMTAAGNILSYIEDVQAQAIPGPLEAMESFNRVAINLLATANNCLHHAGKLAADPSEVEAILVRRGRIETRAEALMKKDQANLPPAKETKYGSKRARRKKGN